MIDLRTTTAFLICILILSSGPEALGSENWKNLCRLAHQLAAQEKYEHAARLYDQSVQILKHEHGDSGTIVDLQLNRISALLSSGELALAESEWRDLRSEVRSLADPMVHIRYYQRGTEVFKAARKMHEWVHNDAMCAQLVRAVMGHYSLSYLRRLKSLAECSIEARLWTPTVFALNELQEIRKSCSNPQLRNESRRSLTAYFKQIDPLIHQRIAQHKLDDVAMLLEHFEAYSPSAIETIDKWGLLLGAADRQNRTDLSYSRIAPALLRIVPHLADSALHERSLIAGLLLQISTHKVYGESVNSQTEQILLQACNCLQPALPQEERMRSLQFIQCKSLYALALASRKNIELCEKILSELKPDTSKFKNASDYNGIFQTRFSLVRQFIASGNRAAAQAQFDEALKLIVSLPPTQSNSRFKKETIELMRLTLD